MDTEDIERLQEIHDELRELVDEAFGLLSGTAQEDRAKAYWYANIRMALDDDHMWMGSHNCTLQNCIESFTDEESDDE